MSEQWKIDPSKGDYVIDDQGKPELTRSLTHPAYYRLKVRRGTWMYAPDSRYGSDFHKILKRGTGQDMSALEAVGTRALQPLIDDGRALEVDVVGALRYRNAAGLEIKIVDAEGEPDTLELDPI